MAPMADTDTGTLYPTPPLQIDSPGLSGEQQVPNINGSSSVESESESSRTRPDVLYGLRLKRGVEESVHYLSQPFFGINYGDSCDTSRYDDLEPSAIILEAQLDGVKEPDFANTPRDWWKKPIRSDFHKRLGSERLVRLTLTIASKRLQDLLSAIIDYDPPQPSHGYHEHYTDDELNFQSLLLYYDEIKTVLACFVQSDLAKQQYPSQLQDLTAQLETFGDVSSVPWGPPYGKIDPLPTIDDIQTACDVGTLLRILTPSYKSTVLPALHHLQKAAPEIEFRNLWMVYKPGTIVYKEIDGSISAYVVVSAILHKGELDDYVREQRFEHVRRVDDLDISDRYIIEAWNLAYNGQFLTRVPLIVVVDEFRAPRTLESLELLPAHWHDKPDAGQTAGRIKQRAHQFREFIEQGCSHRLFKHANSTYEGPVILDPIAYNENRDHDPLIEPPPMHRRDERTPIEPRDTKGYRRFRSYTSLDTRDPKQAEGITDEHLFLLEETISGLALATKKWMQFHVEGIQEGSPFNDVDQLETVLTMENDADREVLQTIKRKTAAQSSESFTLTPDFIPGKGEGQVFLLYGGPGTGKTLSAECVANDTKRPLLSLSMSDLAPYHDTTLRRWFSLGAKWGALIIIDEADVFLAKRLDSSRDPDQLTTVFLRSLEYYAGVLFLTTNRLGQMDDAFISRITVPIWYPELTKVSQRDIWSRFCRRYESYDEEDVKIRVDLEAKDHVMELKENLNGREIRKVMQNALALARLDAERRAKTTLQRRDSAPLKGLPTQAVGTTHKQTEVRIELNHFKKALKRHHQFKKYLTDLNSGRDESLRNKLQHNYLS